MRCIRFSFVLLVCFLFISPSQLAAQALTGYFTSPTDGQTVSNPSITITWTGCSNTTQSSYQTRVNNVLVPTTQSNGLPCPDYSIGKNYSASATLVNGANTLYLRVCDLVDCGESTITVNYILPAAVSVTPDGVTAPSVPHRTPGSYAFTVTNTGGLAATAVFSQSCSGALGSCSVSPASASIAAGASASVTVSYTGETVGSGRASLTATYNEYAGVTDNGFVNVEVTENPIWGVSVTAVEPSRTVSPGTVQIAFDVGNTSQYTSTPSAFTLAPIVDGPFSCIQPPSRMLTPGEPAERVMVQCTIGAVGGRLRLNASAESPAQFSSEDTTIIAVAGTYNVSLTAIDSKTEPARTTSGIVVFTLTNNSQNTGQIRFDLTPVCAGVITCDPLGSVTVAEGASAEISLPYNVSLDGTQGSITLTATSDAPTQTKVVQILTTPDYAVSVSSGASQTLVSGSNSGSTPFTVTNTSSNSASDLAINLAASCTGIISSCIPSAAQVTLTQGAQSTVTVGYGVSLAGPSGNVTLTASPGSPVFAPRSSTTTVNATANNSVTVTPATASITHPAGTTSGSADFTVQNTSTNSSGPITFTLAATCTVVASCTSSQGTVTLAQGASSVKTVSYNLSSSGSGTVALAASSTSPSVPAVTGTTNITVGAAGPSYSVHVTPVNTVVTLPAQTTSDSAAFIIQNTSTNTTGPISFTLATDCVLTVICGQSQAPISLAEGASVTKKFAYDVSAVGDSGSISLTASSSSPIVPAHSGRTIVRTTPWHAIAVLPATGNRIVSQGSSNTYDVTILNQSRNTKDSVTVSLASPACSGTIASCSVPANSSKIAQGAQTSPITLSYIAGSANSTPVTIPLNASGSVTSGTVQVTNASLNVTVTGTTSQPIQVVRRSPGTTIDKRSCLTIAAGQSAAYECGELRVIHELPTTSTMDRQRAPALIYNSRHAYPGALLAADVTYAGLTTPTVLRASVVIAGQADINKDFAWNPACFSTACRVVVPIQSTQPTGLYSAALKIKAMNGSTGIDSMTVTDTVIIVNRASSPFGAGWWIEGRESLVSVGTKMLWIGGDGSARLYTPTIADANVYTVTPAYERADTLRKSGTGNNKIWRRSLGDSSYIEFNNSLQHVKTVNSMGWATRFFYNSTTALLDSIMLPVPASSSAVRSYRFLYTGGLLTSVQSPTPTASVSRATQVSRAGALITSISDPDGLSTAYGYDASNRITSRRNKLGDSTYFDYDSGGALKQARLSTSRTDGSGTSIITSFRAAETRSTFDAADTPTLLANTYTKLDGPRADVSDTTAIFVNRWGAPDSVTNALGQRSRLSRENAAFPALVTKVVAHGGFETRAFFNARALIDSTIAVDAYGPGMSAKTQYVWNPVWNRADSVIDPTGKRTRTFYRTSRPIVDSVRMGTNVARRVKFTYTGDNQLRSVTEAGGLPDSVIYDSRGNAMKTWTPLGRSSSPQYFTQLLKDDIGRDTLMIYPISSDSGITRIKYDAADRVIRTINSGPARPYSLTLSNLPTDTAAVFALSKTDSSGYDAEGNLTYKTSLGSPSKSDVNVTENLTYDAAGRLRKRLIGTGPDSMVYDPAGNLVSARHRSGVWVTQTFDRLNRLTSRVVPEVIHGHERCNRYPISAPISPCPWVFPYYPNQGDGLSLKIPADTARFVYDAATGEMREANNRYARVRRTYYPGGALKTDSTILGLYSSPEIDYQSRGQEYSYDLSGRRTSMTWHLGVNTYQYNDFGALALISDPGNVQYRVAYDLKGQVDSLILGPAVKEKRTYDADGRMTAKTRTSSSANIGVIVSDTMAYDRMNRVISATERIRQLLPDQMQISYDGLGGVLAKQQLNAAGSSRAEEFRNDAFGNVVRRRTQRSGGVINNAPFALEYSPIGELMKSFSHVSSSLAQYEREDQMNQDFVTGGQLARQDQLITNPNNNNAIELQLAARHYYGGDDRLMAVQRYSYNGASVGDGSWEEYWYDALGRRVLTRARRGDPPPAQDAAGARTLCTSTSVCRSFTERVWWDGDEPLVEERTPEGTSDASNSGLIGNIHGLTIDEPLAVIGGDGTRIINYNWRGQGMSSVFTNGEPGDVTFGNYSAEVDWPAMTQAETYYAKSPDATTVNMAKLWLGTFVLNGQGTTGMLYRRNRYFDPKSGQFTQADPIGIAGGMNAFGFANGDPINFSDPFGLWPCPELCVAGGVGVLGAGSAVLEGFGLATIAPFVAPIAATALVAGAVYYGQHARAASRTHTSIGIANEHIQAAGSPPPDGDDPDWMNDKLKHAQKHINNAKKYVKDALGKTRRELEKQIENAQREIDAMRQTTTKGNVPE